MFCDIVAGLVPADIVLADDQVVAFLDARPVFKGHVLVVPPEHVVTLVRFLASPAASLITGHTLLIDGGWTAR